MVRIRLRRAWLVPVLLWLALPAASLPPGLPLVRTHQKISDLEGGLVEDLGTDDAFGKAVAALGDLDGDGTPDAVVGAWGDDDGGTDRGAIYILYLNPDGSVRDEQKISDLAGDPGGRLVLSGSSAHFGCSVTSLGDYDGDGAVELAVGAETLSKVFVIDVDPLTGTIVDDTATVFEIGSGSPNFTTIASSDEFGWSVANLGDWDGDGIPELGIGADLDDYAGGVDPPLNGSGALYVLYLNPPNEPPIVAAGANAVAQTNVATALAGSVTDDGVMPLTVTWSQLSGPGTASFGDTSDPTTDVTFDAAGTYVLELRANDTVFDLADTVAFEVGDPIPGSPPAGDPPPDPVPPPPYRAVGIRDYVLFDADPLNPTGLKTAAAGFFDAGNTTAFGSAVAPVGDLDGNGQVDLAVGAMNRDPVGAVWMLLLADCDDPSTCNVSSAVEVKQESGGFTSTLGGGSSSFGSSLAFLPDPKGDGSDYLLIGQRAWSGGRIWLVHPNANGTVGSELPIGANLDWDTTGLTFGSFGDGIAALGDVDGDGFALEILVGDRLNDEEQSNSGAAWALYLDACQRLVATFEVYHSPTDSGTRLCPSPKVDTFPATLHLYVDGGDVATANPADICRDGLGEGDELCAFELRVALSGGFTIQSFTPALAGLRTNDPAPGSQLLRMTWLAPTPAPLGPLKIGDLVVADDGSGVSDVRVAAGSAAVDAQLLLARIPEDVIAVPEPSLPASWVVGALALAALHRRRRRQHPHGALSVGLVALLALGGSSLATPARAQTAIKQALILNDSGGPLVLPDSVVQRAVRSAAPVGDMNGDGVVDLAIGAIHDGVTCNDGAVYRLFMDRDGTELGVGDVSDGQGNPALGQLGHAVRAVGDLDGNGVEEVAIGGIGCGSDYGSVLIVHVDEAGNETGRLVISQSSGGFGGTLEPNGSSQLSGDHFGQSLAVLGDVDGDGNVEIAIGAPEDDNSVGAGTGAIWIVSLTAPDGTVAWEQKINPDGGGFGGTLAAGDRFGGALASVGDLDDNGVVDLAVGAYLDNDGAIDAGAVWILYLQSSGPGNVSVLSEQKISALSGGFSATQGFATLPLAASSQLGRSLWFEPVPDAGRRGVLFVGSAAASGTLYPMYLLEDGSVQESYAINETSGVGFSDPGSVVQSFAQDVHSLGDLDGDETVDYVVAFSGGSIDGIVLLYMQDTDHDGLDDVLDNCPSAHNPRQDDGDGDGVGDLCDNCVDVANSTQDDLDADGEGDSCEPVEVVLQVQAGATPTNPAWDLTLQCGTYHVTGLAGAIVVPAGAADPKTLSLSGASVGSSLVSGPGLGAPAGVRGDAIYFQATGNGAPDNRLCTALDPPVLLGSLTTGALSGTQLALASLTGEGVGTPGFGLNLAQTTGPVAVPLSDVRLVNGLPFPILDLELGPAVQTASGTRWEVRAVRSSAEFHRVAFGLIAPVGTTTGQMHWRGCDTTPDGSGARLCCESPPCGDFDGLGVGTNVNPNRAFTVGPQASPPGTQLPHTLYVVLEGSALSSGSLDTVNPFAEGQYHILGEVELIGSPDLEPALTRDGVDAVTFPPALGGGAVVPLVDVAGTPRSVDEVKLIGAFNPSDDLDGDGIQDLGDNCPFAANAGQSNRGSFLDSTDASDTFGDACQCAEATGDGAVLDPDDFDEIRDYLSGRITNPVIAQQIEERCSVVGTTECNIRDLLFLKIAMDSAAPAVETRCDAALAPAGP